MANSIRRAIGPTKNRLKKYFDELENFSIGQPSQNQEQEVYYEGILNFINERLSQIDGAVDYLEKNNEKWLRLIEDPDNPNAQRDEISYEAMQNDEENGLIWILDRAREAMGSLKAYRENVQDILARIRSQQLQATVPDFHQSRRSTPSQSDLGRAPSVELSSALCDHAEPQRIPSVPQRSVRLEVKLPKLKLTEFDGDLRKWREFSAHFRSAVGEQNIPTIQKLNYLKSCLKGSAARAVEGYEACEENYQVIWNLLHERFGNSTALKRDLYNELQNMKPNDADFRGTVENIQRILRQLESLGESVEQPYLEMLIEKLLPAWVLAELYAEKERIQPWSMFKLRSHLEMLARRKEEVDRIKDLRRTWPKEGKPFNLKTKEPFQKPTSTFSALDKSAKRLPAKPCVFCNNKHWNDDCKLFDTWEKRIEQLRNRNICFKCLQNGHTSKNCQKEPRCFHCKGLHNSALCSNKLKREGPSRKFEKTEIQKDNRNNADEVVANTVSQTKGDINQQQSTILLLCKTVWIANSQQPEKKTEATVFFDTGCQQSFITEDLVKKLGIRRTQPKSISIASFAEKQPKAFNSHSVNFNLILENGKHLAIAANTMKFLTQKILTTSVDNKQARLLQAVDPKRIDLLTAWKQPQIIVGLDYYFSIIKRTRKILRSGFLLIDSKVGWILAGKGQINCRRGAINAQTGIITNPVVDQFEVNQFWRLDAIGISDPIEITKEEVAVEQFERSITRDDEGRYCVSWPWKTESPRLPTNYAMCLARLKSTVKRLRQDHKIFELYDQTFKKHLADGIIEEVGLGKIQGRTTYLPHQPVITPAKTTTKLRVVFDASAKSAQGKSLNDELLKGPCILPDLCGILLRFRQAKIVILADVEKAFLQVGLHEEDRDCTRFLWIKDKDQPFTEDNLQEYRFTRVPFGVVSSPFLLASTIRKHLKQEGSPTAQEILQNLYVDNVMLTAETANQAIEKYEQTKELFRDAKMNIREFIGNNPHFNQAIPDEDCCRNQDNIKVLGVPWTPAEDKIILQIVAPTEDVVTKRKILHFLASVYDPAGWITPVLIPLKCFLQELWKKEYQWDTILKNEEQEEWQNLVSSWKSHRFTLPRQIQHSGYKWQLHVFVDASTKAYAAAVYLRESRNQQVSAHLVFAKARLCPVKGASMPRLELLAALVGVRLLNFVREQLNLNEAQFYIWSDSKCVLHWIRSKKEISSRFIANRLEEIKKAKASWNYVPTQENPADIASRGCTPRALQRHQPWWTGPPWLSLPKEEWPKWEQSESTKYPEEANEAEQRENKRRKDVMEQDANMPIAATVVSDFKQQIQWVDPARFSRWMTMQGSLAKAIRFTKNLRNKERKSATYEDYKEAETLLLQQAQYGNISDEEMRKWALIKDENHLWRCGGRLINSQLPQHCKSLIYLPRSQWITVLIVQHYHESHLHNGVAHTLAQLRQRFWIPKGRAVVKKTINNCKGCRRWRAKPYQLPQFPPHPMQRVNPSRAFQHIGLDYMGPVYIAEADGSSKRWICLFTCLTTRAIHLEIAMNLTAEAFISCVRRFVARRGVPESILCDNASQFKLAAKTTETAIGQVRQELEDYCTVKAINWKFVTESAPWKGGLYERLVGLVKKSFRIAVGQKLLKEEQLHTLVCEIEGILNARPLTYLDEESSDTIRPIDFLIPKSELAIPVAEETEPSYQDTVQPRDKVLQMWRGSMKCLNRFWKFWQCNYLNMLRERSEMDHKKPKSTLKCVPQLKEIVLMAEHNQPRGKWKMGKIVEVVKGKDGQVRTASVQLANGRILTRPINSLLPLEVSVRTDANAQQTADPNLEEEASEVGKTNPRLDTAAGRKKSVAVAERSKHQRQKSRQNAYYLDRNQCLDARNNANQQQQ